MTTGDRLIAVAGEALVDLVLEPEGTTTRHLGGGSFNAARTIGRLGLAPVFVGRISNDVHGRALRSGLSESGVRLDGVVDTNDPTTFALVELDGHGAASYHFYADGTSISGLLPEQARDAMPPLARRAPRRRARPGVRAPGQGDRRTGSRGPFDDPGHARSELPSRGRPYPAVHRERLRELAGARRRRQGQRGGPRVH